MRALQLNINHCEAAHDVLTHTVFEQKIGVAIIVVQHKNSSGRQCQRGRQSTEFTRLYELFKKKRNYLKKIIEKSKAKHTRST